MFWRIHKAIFDNKLQEAKSILEHWGDTVQVVEGNVTTIEPIADNMLQDINFCITTLQDARSLLRNQYSKPLFLFYHPTRYDVSAWSASLPDNIPWLNRHGVFIPYQHLFNHPILAHLIVDNGRVFIRPNSGNKIFTGFDIAVDNQFNDNLKNQMLFAKPDGDTMCYVAPYKNIEKNEWRFWFCEHKVVACTPYSWSDSPSLVEPPQQIQSLAEQLASSSFNPDYAYVADFVLDDKGKAYLIEVNAASTSGVYNADLNALLLGLRTTIIRDYNMEIDY